jgi:hypothetical protein
MSIPSSKVGYNSATTGRGGHEVHKGHVVAKKLSYGADAKTKAVTEKRQEITKLQAVKCLG